MSIDTSVETNENIDYGLTTTKAPFIEQAVANGQLYIDQPYDLYSEYNQTAWRNLYERIYKKWEQYASAEFLEGVHKLNLKADAIPRLDDINQFLDPLSGFKAKAVSGYVPAYKFFDCLRQRSFPTTITIRDAATLDYLPEPDIFHDIAGHVPMHTSREFSDVLVHFGEVAKRIVIRANELDNEKERIRIVTSKIKALARFFWFTIEFGLVRQNGELKAYGSGILSSKGELEFSIDSPLPQRYPAQLEWMINQYFEIDHYQPLYFVIESFEHLFDMVQELDRWSQEGKLDNVAPGEPEINEEDLNSFLHASV